MTSAWSCFPNCKGECLRGRDKREETTDLHDLLEADDGRGQVGGGEEHQRVGKFIEKIVRSGSDGVD